MSYFKPNKWLDVLWHFLTIIGIFVIVLFIIFKIYLPSFSKFLKIYPSVALSSWAVLRRFLETSKWTSRLLTMGLASMEFTGASWPIRWNETINLGSSTSRTLIRFPLFLGSLGSWNRSTLCIYLHFQISRLIFWRYLIRQEHFTYGFTSNLVTFKLKIFWKSCA